MAKYSPHKIQVLLTSAGLKAGVENFDKRGFDTLSKAIAEELKEPIFGVTIDARYLKESIHDKLIKAEAQNVDELGFNRDYIDTLSYYAGYQSFDAFQAALDKWDKLVQAAGSKNKVIGIFSNPKFDSVSNELQSLIQRSKLESERPLLDHETPDINFWVDRICLAIAIVNNSLQLNEIDKPLLGLGKDSSVPLVFYTSNQESDPNPPEELIWRKGLLARDNDLLLILAALALYGEAGELEKTKKGKDSKYHISAENVGAIIDGNSRIKAKYLSSRDMHINITKNAKRDH